MPRGQTSTQAEQVVHAHRVSSNIISPTSAGAEKSFLRAAPRNGTVATASKCRRTSCTTLRGESGFPASKAGHCCSHRPHETHASSSMSCQRLNCSTRVTPISPVSSTCSIDTGESLPRRSMPAANLTVPAIPWRSRVYGKSAITVSANTAWNHHVAMCQSLAPAGVIPRLSKPRAKSTPTNETPGIGVCSRTIRNPSSTYPVIPMIAKRASTSQSCHS